MGMRRKPGFTLVEVLISVLILSILALYTLNFILSSELTGRRTIEGVDDNMNLRMGLEYLAREIHGADSIRLIERIGGSENEVTFIEAGSVDINPRFYFYINEDKIFLIDNILRRHTESHQIISGIKSFSVKSTEEGIYTIKITSEGNSVSTKVCRGK